MTASRPVALLMGAGDAIGAAVARRFAAGGLQVCVARRDAAKAKPLIDEVAASDGTLQAFSVDARQEAAVQDLFAKVERDVGPIEVCLYNAGSNVNTPLLETTETLFRKSWELACYGGFLTGREAARHMVPRGHGTILFTGATVAQSMARELGPKNIHVAHLLIDGGVDSEAIRKRMRARIGDKVDSLPANALIQTKAIAEAYWALHVQPTYGWTHELDLRTSIERW
jgi:hypothetical protein